MAKVTTKKIKVGGGSATAKPAVAKNAAFKVAKSAPNRKPQDRDSELYVLGEGRVLIPKSHLQSVQVSKIETSLDKAQQEVLKLVKRFSKFASAEYEIREIEISLGFDAEGKFLGVGVGSAASIKMKIAPK